jgi:hypothetical protein
LDQAGNDDITSTHPFAANLVSALACLLVFFELLVPNEFSRLTPGAFVSVPLEALLGVAFLLVLPAKARPVVATFLGLALGLLALMKTLDMGFFAILARPFDPVMDWTLFQDGMRFLAGAIGPFAAIGCLAAAVVFSTALLILTAGAVRRSTRLFIQHNAVASRAVVVIAVPWLACAVLGTQVVPGVRVAAASTVVYLQHRPAATRPQDRESFAANAAADSFADTPGKELLPGLRGKDVIVVFVESYGRSAIEDPGLAPPITAVLEAGNRQLRAAGFGSRSGFLTSPTTGGGSWLAHSTLLSGLWIDNQQRYDDFAASHRLTLTSAFRRANWRTIGVMPGNDGPWPQSESLGYDRIYDAQDMGYHGPRFSWATMPDQYTFLRFEHTEHARQNRPPVMAEITLVSSHAPWEPVPRLIKWGDVGDGSVFDGMATAEDKPEAILTRNPERVRTDYRTSIAYSLSSLISYVENYGDDKLVLIFLGDHQPSPIVTGPGASRDVPITIVTRDRAVLNRISRWGWQEDLKPSPQAPVWPMDAFRDRFLTVFGSQNPPISHRH